MRVSRRKFLTATGAALAAPAIARPAFAQAQVTLKLHHFLPPISNGHSKMLAPWAKAVEQDSGGKIKIDIFPSMQLGGTPPQLYDQARDGVVDIVWTLPGSTAGRFPSTEVFELPFIAARRGIVNARASQEYADANLAKETSDIKVLSYWSHDHGLIHANKPDVLMDDLRGLKLRSPHRLAGEALLDMVKKRGNTVCSVSEDEKARWIKATQPVIDSWVAQVKDKGLDGNKLIEQAKALVAKYDKA